MTYRTYLGALTGAALFSLAACSTSPDIDGSPSSDLGAQSTPSELTIVTGKWKALNKAVLLITAILL